MSNCNAVSTPFDKSDVNTNAKPLSTEVPYREAVGSLLYLTNTRPDICYAVSMVAQHVTSPTIKDWNQVERILRYLQGSKDYVLHYTKRSDEPKILKCYTDADFAGDENSRKSRSGCLCLFAGGAISWFSKKQNCISLSTTEAEYVAASEAVVKQYGLKAC
ncbi:uncharacterized protein LOC128982477 [Macrosteles quadrilineatus]|uniref:uncharacterized protein LOC128982477 n=1 Tax=Macrosteles quadrilineatus TaxID=74068 RepID=UPI0023E14940|nr:uncharacterized protein LOC128982477 [Macrosteles quadrilineatus]